MTKLRTKQRNLNYLSSLLLLIGFLTCGAFTQVHATTTTSTIVDQQTTPITGRVLGADDNEPLPGVNVIIKGTTNGVTTNFDGFYSIENVSEGDVLVFSFMGFTTQEVLVKGQKEINLGLQTDSQSLDEVVVVGYGTTKKETLTGSIATVTGEDIVKTPAVNVTSTLQGRLPGLTASQRSGEPGNDDPSILIRATATTGNNSPLIIIDGVQRTGIGQLNSEDIENISVLKGASATIYGARAANGVILVTTKKGRASKPEFSFSYSFAMTNPTQDPDLLSSPEYAETFNEAVWYDAGRPDVYDPYYSDEVIQKFRDGSEPELYPDTDWNEEVLNRNSQQQRIGLSVTGGTDNTRYLLSFLAQTQEGNYKNNPTSYKQFNMRAKFDVDVTDNLTLGANINGIVKNKEFSSQGVGTNFYNIIRAIPTLVAVYDNGLIAPGRLGQSPLLLDQRGYNHTDETPIYTTFTATYKIPFVEGLRFDASYNYDMDTRTKKVWNLPYSSHQYNVNTGEYDVYQVGIVAPELTDRMEKYTTSLWNYRFTYDKSFGDHQFTAMVGQEQQHNQSSWVQAYRRNYVSSAIAEINVGSTAADDKDNGGSSYESAYNNWFGRINYDYQSKYMADIVFRSDGSQNFPEGKRYGNFYSVSGAWRLSEENFIKDNFENVDQLKLRVSHGTSGNDNVGQYQYLQSYQFGQNHVFGTTDVPGVYSSQLANPNITWEKSSKTDIGLDASFWNGMLGIDFTYWWEHRTDILETRNLSIPEILGFPSLPDENIGEVDSNGFELSLSHRNMNHELTYMISANVAYANSEIIYMDETPPAEPYQSQTGMMVGSGLYYETDGIYNTQEELDNSVHHSSTQVGDIKILDMNDDGQITDADRVRMDRTSTPKYVFALNTSFEYKNFDLAIFFQGQAGAVNYDDRFASLALGEQANSFSLRAEDRWTVDNPDGTMPRARDYVPGQNTFFLQDASFVRLKSAELGFTLPADVAAKMGGIHTRIYLSGSNVLTWAKEIKHVDPEISGRSTYYPQVRIFNIGVNVKF